MVEPEKYTGTGAFVNLRNITDQHILKKAESVISTFRLTQLYNDPSVIGNIGDKINFDLPHLKAIHKYLFQDIYSWAGETRSYTMKIDIDIFTPPDEIEYWAAQIALEIKQNGYLLNQSRESVVIKVARYLGLLGMLHPFPEGNGRTQRAFLWQLTLAAGYTLKWERVHSWENRVTAQNVHRRDDFSGMERMIDRILAPADQTYTS